MFTFYLWVLIAKTNKTKIFHQNVEKLLSDHKEKDLRERTTDQFYLLSQESKERVQNFFNKVKL